MTADDDMLPSYLIQQQRPHSVTLSLKHIIKDWPPQKQLTSLLTCLFFCILFVITVNTRRKDETVNLKEHPFLEKHDYAEDYKSKPSQSLTSRTVIPESMTETTTLMDLPEDVQIAAQDQKQPFSLSISLDDIPRHQFVTTNKANVNPLFPCDDPNWLFIEHDDDKMEHFLRFTFPDLNLNEELKFIVEEADLYRYAVINHYGGLYMDSDTQCQHPVSEWMNIMHLDQIEFDDSSNYILENVLHRMIIPFQRVFASDPVGPHTIHVSMVLGIEFYDTEYPLDNFNPNSNFQFVQWAFLSKPNNVILSLVMENVLDNLVNIEDERENIEERTGPKVFSKTILSFIEEHSLYDSSVALWDYRQIDVSGQVIPLLFDDEISWILVLPYRAFGFHGMHRWPPSVSIAKEDWLIHHRFRGSWRH